MLPFRGNFELRPLGVAMGNVVSVTRVWSIHTKTPHVGRRQPMTSLPARLQYKGAPGKHVILFFVFSDCFVWSVHSTGKNDFLLLLWRALARHLRDVCIRVLVIWHLMTRGGNLRALWAFFYEKAPLSSVSLFEEGGAAVCFPRFKTHCCRGTEGNELVGLSGGSGWWVREGAFLLALVSRERGWVAGWWWCDLSDIIWSSG